MHVSTQACTHTGMHTLMYLLNKSKKQGQAWKLAKVRSKEGQAVAGGQNIAESVLQHQDI